MSIAPVFPDRLRHAPSPLLAVPAIAADHAGSPQSLEFTLKGIRAERVQIVNGSERTVLARRAADASLFSASARARHVLHIDAAEAQCRTPFGIGQGGQHDLIQEFRACGRSSNSSTVPAARKMSLAVTR